MEQKAVLGKTALVRAGLSFLIAVGVLVVLMVGIALAASLGIDTFDNGDMELAAPWSEPRIVSGTVTSTVGILGTERDVYVEITNGSGSSRVFVTVYSTTNRYSHSQDDGVTGYSIVTWDGEDGDPTSLNPTGLGGVDLTSGGVYTGFGWLQVSGDLQGVIVIIVTTDASNYSVYTTTTQAGNDLYYFAPFNSFVIAGGSGADFGNVGSISLKVDGTNRASFDTSIDFFDVPEFDYGDLPSSYNNVVLADNGARHVIVTGTGGVHLGTYIDAEGDGQESANANGDDSAGIDDEDGVQIGGLWDGSGSGLLTVTVSGGGGCVMGWMDFHTSGPCTGAPNGVLTNSNETVLNNVYVSGTQAFLDDWLACSLVNKTNVGARFRVIPDQDGDGDCSDQVALAPAVTGLVYNGEVEDYLWSFGTTAVTLRRLEAQPARYGLVIALVLGVVVIGGIGLFAVRRRRA
jgi:hypothetical protein